MILLSIEGFGNLFTSPEASKKFANQLGPLQGLTPVVLLTHIDFLLLWFSLSIPTCTVC